MEEDLFGGSDGIRIASPSGDPDLVKKDLHEVKVSSGERDNNPRWGWNRKEKTPDDTGVDSGQERLHPSMGLDSKK